MGLTFVLVSMVRVVFVSLLMALVSLLLLVVVAYGARVWLVSTSVAVYCSGRLSAQVLLVLPRHDMIFQPRC